MKDINATTGAIVRFDTSSVSPVTLAHIQGSRSQVKQAIDLLKIGVIHATAAHQKPPSRDPFQITLEEQVALDLYTFAHETSSMAFRSWYPL